MLTRAGGWLLLSSVALAVTGRALGLVELYVLAVAAVAAVAVATVYVAATRPRVEVRRTVRPTRVHVGSPARVEIEVTARTTRPTPVLTFVDPIGDRVGARLNLAPIAGGAVAVAAYRLPTRRRGEVAVGPLRIELTDPLGLARRSIPVAERVVLLVLPHIDPVPPATHRAGSEPLSGQEGRAGMGRSGDDFHSLRPYVVGDDIRRVHWPMSARHDELVVRHDDEPRQGRLTVVLDVAAPASEPEPFEHMVSAAASIAAAHWAHGDIVRLLCSNGRDTGWVTGQAAFEGLLEVLAVAQRVRAASLARILGRTDVGTDTVIAITGGVSDVDVAALSGRRSARAGGQAGLSVVRFGSRRVGSDHRRLVAGIRVLDISPEARFAVAWKDAVDLERRSRSGAGR